MRSLAATVFLAGQVAYVIYSLFIDTKNFCWSPHTTQTEYWVSVESNGRPLTEEEIRTRYRLGTGRLWEAHAIANVKAWISRFEETYGADDRAKVTLIYRINGGPLSTWSYARQDTR